MDRRQFLVGAAVLATATAAGAVMAPAAEAHPRKPGRNLIRNGSFEEGLLGVPQIDDWVVTVAPA